MYLYMSAPSFHIVYQTESSAQSRQHVEEWTWQKTLRGMKTRPICGIYLCSETESVHQILRARENGYGPKSLQHVFSNETSLKDAEAVDTASGVKKTEHEV